MPLTDLTLPLRLDLPVGLTFSPAYLAPVGDIRDIVSILSACSSSGPLFRRPRNRAGGARPAAADRLDTL